MFKQSKWTVWHDSLSASTQAYLKNQAVWHDRDMFKAVLFGCVIGLIIGLVI